MTYGIRPEHIEVGAGGAWMSDVCFAGRLGNDTFLRVGVEEVGRMIVRADGDTEVPAGSRVRLTPHAGREHRFDAEGRRKA
ncbi:TOBE domain-containing protein [Bradyrhizobium sp. USDA 4454]